MTKEALAKSSLAFRRHERDIRRGRVPEKYRRIVPFITGSRVLEIGSAEGVLALLLATMDRDVIAVEARPDRHDSAVALKEEWLRRGMDVASCRLVNCDIRNCLALLQDIDTVVAVRSIYYLREDLPIVFREIERRVDEVVLCGNPNRWPKSPGSLGQFNKFASAEGMRGLLTGFGYRIAAEVTEGDPIVVGRRNTGSPADHP